MMWEEGQPRKKMEHSLRVAVGMDGEREVKGSNGKVKVPHVW
jgi:hypothetical protein